MPETTIALVQLEPTEAYDANVEAALNGIAEAARQGAEAVFLPESFHVKGPSELRFATATPIPGPLSDALSAAARDAGVWLLAGSFNEKIDRPDKLSNTSLLFGPDGAIVESYRKIHLFDVTVGDEVVARESDRNLAGDRTVVVDTPFGRMGLSICYDVRFPELYRTLALQGAELLAVPSNFAMFTGKDHWEVLLRARAIENGAYVIAPATTGRHGGFASYGRSLVVDPWGTVVACASDGR
uniref:carbon-nitrogen hydrolase family protein n=1 Tax=uncultured Demequina sp. TaxID=693499 RepID=UPI0025F2B697